MPSYKVTYFNARGKAEPVRMLLTLAGQKFEDVRVAGESWTALKPKTPLGQLPVLTVDGKQLPQSRAQASYVAREFGMYGANSWEAAEMDAVLETVSDIFTALVKVHYGEPDEAKRPAAMEKFQTEVVPGKLKGVNDLLASYGNGFFVGNKISIADVFFYCVMEALKKEEVAKFPKLSALIEKIASNDKLAAYLKTRPVTEF